MVDNIFSLFLLAILVEGIITYFVSDPEKPQAWIKYVSAALGILVCIAYNVDLLSTFGVISAVPYVGSVLTGLVIGRGSNYLNDLISKIRQPQAKVTTVSMPENVSTVTATTEKVFSEI